MKVLGQELLDHMKATQNKMEHMKMRAMYLYKIEKKKAAEVASIVGTIPGNIYQWASRYKQQGVKGLVNKPKGGRRTAFMTLEEEKSFLEEIMNDASKGLVVVTHIIRKKAEERLEHAVSADYAEDLLNRHGWRKVMPRTKHPKSSKDQQEEFKKKFLKLFPKP